MPDGIDLKRIIDLDPETTVTDDDYTIVDSTTGGAKKFAIGQALGEIKDGLYDSTLTFVSNYEGKTLVNNEALKTNGGIMSQTGRAHTAYINGSVPAKGISLDLSGYCFRIWYYTGITEGTFVKYDPNYYSGDGAIHWIGSEYKIRVCFYHDPVDTVEFTETELQNIKSNFKLYDYTDVIQNNEISEINTAIDGLNNALNFAYVTKAPLTLGSLIRTSGAPSFTHDTLLKYRSTPLISVDGAVRISCDENDSATITSFNIYQYKEDTKNSIQFVSAIRNLTFTDNAYTYTPSSDSIKYIRITLVLTENTQAKIQPLTLNSTAKVKICKNPNITTNSSGGNPRIELAYYVSGDTYTSGQLILPPNYTIDGKPCPLAVFFHGTTSMNTWDEAIGSSTSGIRNCLDYVTQEGFAVFDCYVFTSKYYSESGQHQGAPLPIFLEAYISGIKHICENYNVDSDNICFWANSAGANLGYLLAHSATDVVPRAIAMLSPSTGFASLIQRIFFLNESMRNIIVNYLGLTNETNADVFISTNKGLDNANAVAFVEDHLDSFAGMICGAINAHGATFADQYDWMMDGTTTLPAWMQDLPPIPADWTTSPATGIPKMVLHPELTMHSPIPIKYWQAFDDTNTCGYATYTIYQWLKNGGSNVHWRTMPNNTGGHHAVDIGEGALKSSGTTRLGIAYTDAPTAYVEMVDFFYQNMSQ